jgi:general nucleoside transport system permease protein
MFRFQRVETINSWTIIATRIGSVLAAVALGAVLFAATGYDVPMLAKSVARGSFGNLFALEDLGLLISPLILTGLAAAVTLRMGLWNIGGEGQFYAGAMAATVIGVEVHGDPAVMLLVLGIGGFLGGMIWILIPALARAYLAVDEIITTLLLNFVAILLVNFISTGPLRDPGQAVTSATARIPYEVPTLIGDLHLGLGVAVALAVVMALVMAYSRWGYEVRLAGANRFAAHYAGIPVPRRLLQTMLLSGGMAGIAGMLEVAGTVHRLQGGISNNFGYLGVMVAVLAGGQPIGVVPAAVLMGIILNGGIVLQSYGVSIYEVLALTGLILLFIAVGEQLAYFRIPRAARRPVR